eukprot:8685212-Alexandrium_andersonii.AAC.1
MVMVVAMMVMMMMMATCHYRHHASRHGAYSHGGDGQRKNMAQTRSPKLSRGPFRATVCAEREYGNENPPGAPEG